MKSDYVKLKNVLMDEESQTIFDARIAYMQTGDTFSFIKEVHNLYKNFQYLALDRFMEGREEKEYLFVIFGAGYEGKIALEILKHTKYVSNLYGFCDNNKELWGKNIHGLPVMSIYELLSQNKEIIYILASSRYNYHFLYQLLNLGISHKKIFISQHGGFIAAQRGWQYFDVFQPRKQEVFVDAGAYDGMTSRDFIQWCHGKYDYIYMFELNSNMRSICYDNIKTNKNIDFVGKGVWDKNTYSEFLDSQSSSFVKDDSSNSASGNFVELCTIDSVLAGKKATFIKMDVEGSELKALYGAQETIKKLKPRLAISVYHKLDDTVNIMEYLMELNPEYKFYLRHYTACQWETVLYAV